MKRAAPMPDQLELGFGGEAGVEPPVGASEMLQMLHAWSEAGILRRLDSALAEFIVTLCPSAPPLVLLATALVSHLEGQGHSCMPLDELVGTGGAALEWPEDAALELAEVMQRLPRLLTDWISALRSCDVVGTAAGECSAAEDKQPLVISGSLLYLRRYWRYETTVARRVLDRVATPDEVDPARLRTWLDRLFPAVPAQAGIDWQKAACAIALRGRFSIVTGGPGTGKTFTAARILALAFALSADPQGMRVALAAPTGKAAARLKDSIAGALTELQPLFAGEAGLQDLATRIGDAKTLHRLLGARPDTRRFRHDASNLLDIDLLLVDEASMVHLEMMAALLAALPSHTRVILLGDKDQLASVEAGSVLGDLCAGAGEQAYDQGTREFLGTSLGVELAGKAGRGGSALTQQVVRLTRSRRFSGAIGSLALAVNDGDHVKAAELLRDPAQREGEWISSSGTKVQAEVVRLALGSKLSSGCREYCELLKQRPEAELEHEAWVRRVLQAFDSFRVLCAVREGEGGVVQLNAAIERALAAEGLLNRSAEWYEGRPVIVLKNDSSVGIYNGDVGVALRAPERGGGLRVYFVSGEKLRSLLTTRLGHVETAFAMTVHKSQGSEFMHTALVIGEPGKVSTGRELVYTGITRAKKAFSLVTSSPDILEGSLARRTSRRSGLDRKLRSGDA